VPVDLTQAALGPALAAAGHQESRPTTWVLEGVIPYLTPDDAAATVAAVAARSAPGSRLVASYQTGSPRAVLGRLLARGFLLLTGRGDPMAFEPRRSSWTPESVRALLADSGLRFTADIDLLTLAGELSVRPATSAPAASPSPTGPAADVADRYCGGRQAEDSVASRHDAIPAA
jgi:O-methyltransferase involved in polyketide biosynthesis